MAAVCTPRPQGQRPAVWGEGQVWVLPTLVSRPVHEVPVQKEASSGNAGWGRKMLLSLTCTAWLPNPSRLSKKIEHFVFMSWLAWFVTYI